MRGAGVLVETAGGDVARRTFGDGLRRWGWRLLQVFVVGAVGVGAYAYYDTSQVARTAIALFEREIEIAPAPPPAD